MMKSDDVAKAKQSCGSRLRDDVSRIFDCFLIVNRPDHTKKSKIIPDYKYPKNFNDEEILQQTQLFCFPFSANSTVSTFRDHANHFTFILTDIEGKHRFGFCKLINEGNKCYCILSFLPWFEIFYKILNYTHELSLKSDEETMETMLMELHQQPVLSPNDKLQFSPTLSFSIPDTRALPSIPENINLSEYYAAVNIIFMMEVFASLMFERRIIFTSKSLSVLTSCIHSAEALLNPLHWQHIFIPVMPPHLIDYCLAPMPYLVGVHSSLMPKVQEMVDMDDDVIIADIDKEDFRSVHSDLERIPNDTASFLKSLLRKPDVKVGRNLAQAFLRVQARLIGGYRRGLKFKPGEPILFDEDRFIESYKSNTTREFARSLVQLQTFKQFVDGRLDMLNGGIGFRDEFENEVNVVDAAGSKEGDTYKEWLNAAKKGGNKLFIQMQRMAKDNMKSAQQTWKNYLKQQQLKQESSINRQKSLDQTTERLRPSRPPPIDPERLAEINRARQRAPSRPPLPNNFPQVPIRNSKRTRVYTELNLDSLDVASTSDPGSDRDRSMSNASYPSVSMDLVSDMEQVLDQKFTAITSPSKEAKDQSDLLPVVNAVPTNSSQNNDKSPEKSPLHSIDKKRSSSDIRRRGLVTSRPNSLKQKAKDQSPSSEGSSPVGDSDSTSQNTDQLVDLTSSRSNSEAPTAQSTETSPSTTSNDLLSLDFTSFGAEQKSESNPNQQNWPHFNSVPKKGPPDVFDPFGPHPTDNLRNHSPALAPFVSSSPFVVGQMSSGSSRNSSPTKTPQRLSPEKLNAFKVKQGPDQPTFSGHPTHINDFSRTFHNTSPLHRNSSNRTMAVQSKPVFTPQHRSTTGTTNPPSRPNSDNELFSDLLGNWKTKEGM